MSEVATLLETLQRLRELTESRTTLSAKRQKEISVEARNLGDRCCIHVGWLTARPGEGEGIGATIIRDMVALIEEMEEHFQRRPRRGPHLDLKTFLIDGLIWGTYNFENPDGKSLAYFVNVAAEAGKLDETKSTEAHEKRIRRLDK
jgi:hypothetical protein